MLLIPSREVICLKTLALFLEKFRKKDDDSKRRLDKNRTRSFLDELGTSYLMDFDDTLTIEVSKKALDSIIEIVENGELASKYEIYQISETMFQMRLAEINL